MLPLFRTIFVGGVLVMLALLAGFGAPRSATSSARLTPLARGPLINVAEHPEWKQFLIQAAYQRSDQIDRLKDLPDTPTVMPAPVIEAVPPIAQPDPPVIEQAPPTPEPEQVAALSPALDDTLPADPTGSLEASPSDLPIDIGEASATELPITIQDLPVPIERPQTIKRLNETHRTVKPAKRRHARAQRPAVAKSQPTQQSDFFGSLFGGNDQASASPNH